VCWPAISPRSAEPTATFQSAVDYMDCDTQSRLVESRMNDFPNIKFAADFLLEATVLSIRCSRSLRGPKSSTISKPRL
jgi:hypothetical protein